jgi:hypothetical protein
MQECNLSFSQLDHFRLFFYHLIHSPIFTFFCDGQDNNGKDISEENKIEQF